MRLAILVLVAALSALIPPRASAQRTERAARLVQTGRALVTSGNPNSAISYFRQAIHVDSHFADAYLELAELYMGQRRDALALEVIQVGLRRVRSPALHLLLARAQRERGDLNEAARTLLELVRREPSWVPAHAARAEVARARGRWSEALASYRAILALAEEGATVSEETVTDARRYVGALQLLVGELDPASRCTADPLRSALCAL